MLSKSLFVQKNIVLYSKNRTRCRFPVSQRIGNKRKDSGVDMDVEFYARRTLSLAKLDSHLLDIFFCSKLRLLK